jgi:hypothetical protein
LRGKRGSSLGDKLFVLLSVLIVALILVFFVGAVGGKMIELGWIKNINQ